MFPYKIQTQQPLSPEAIDKRLEFGNVVLNWLDNNEINFGQIWFSDEAHFHLDGCVNKQNWRIWGTENPHFSIEKSLHPQRVTVWCALSSRGIIGAEFIDGTVQYVEVLKEKFISAIQCAEEFDQMWLMQDGARPHRTREVFDLLEEHFDERIITLDYNKETGKGID